MTTYTFKSNSSKSNAKRFLVATAKVPADKVDNYLTMVDGKWGTYLDEAGKPVDHAIATKAPEAAPAPAPSKPAKAPKTKAAPAPAEPPAPAPAEPPAAPAEPPAPATPPVEAEDEPALPQDAFGRLAMAQLTAPSNNGSHVPAPAPVNTSTPAPAAGQRKIVKERETRNGITRKSPGTVQDQLWKLYAKIGSGCTLQQAKQMAEAVGLNSTSAAIALYEWRKFNGYPTGRKGS